MITISELKSRQMKLSVMQARSLAKELNYLAEEAEDHGYNQMGLIFPVTGNKMNIMVSPHIKDDELFDIIPEEPNQKEPKKGIFKKIFRRG